MLIVLVFMGVYGNEARAYLRRRREEAQNDTSLYNLWRTRPNQRELKGRNASAARWHFLLVMEDCRHKLNNRICAY